MYLNSWGICYQLGKYFAIVVGVFEFFWIVHILQLWFFQVLKRMLSQNQKKTNKKDGRNEEAIT
jgi:hypothetical protein